MRDAPSLGTQRSMKLGNKQCFILFIYFNGRRLGYKYANKLISLMLFGL